MVGGRGAAGPMKRQNMDETLNTGNESAPFAPKSYSASSNFSHTHTHQPFVLLLICLAGSKKRIKNGRAY